VTLTPTAAVPEPTRACYPDDEGYVEVDGVRSFYEVYGDGDPTFLLLPTWSIVHSRVWKPQIAYLARHFRVVTFDGRGNGRSDRPTTPEAYGPVPLTADTLAVMDATGTASAITVSSSQGTLWNLLLCARYPERVSAAVFIGSLFPVVGPMPDWATVDVQTRRDEYAGAERYNRHYMLNHFEEFLMWWGRRAVPEPHSELSHEYLVAYGLQTSPEAIVNTLGPIDSPGVVTMSDMFEQTGGAIRGMAEQVLCPAVVIHGDLDDITPPHWGEALAELTGGELVTLPYAGHAPASRWPVAVNHMLRDIALRVKPPSRTGLL
jgi:pimeloyl-ACP methyl ester carboxylesterase